MKTRGTLIAACVLLVFGTSARGQFTPGHVFVSDADPKNCLNPPFPGGDRIWEIDPATGDVTLFVELTADQCGLINGLAFTPDGTRLRASLERADQIVEFDSEGNLTVALDADDGISRPHDLAYDADGNFYVLMSVVGGGRILRFALGGPTGTVFADEQDGIGNHGAMAFAADGDLYYGNDHNVLCNILRITPGGNVIGFDQYEPLCSAPRALAADEGFHVYVGLSNGGILRYDVGNPASRELIVPDSAGLRFPAMTMSLDDTRIYVATDFNELSAVDPVDGTVTAIANLSDAFIANAGIAVAPSVPRIPAMSEWGLVVMTILLLSGATIVIGGMSLRSRSQTLPWAARAFSIRFFGGES